MSTQADASAALRLRAETTRKVVRRLVPFMILLFLVNQIDRINVGFAALTMNRDLGFTPYLFGWGAGIFFFGYILFEVPSNVLMHRIGARTWMARIMFTWGLVACGMAFVTGPASFLTMRFLLGVAEAGFTPGMTLYLIYWIPQQERARVQSLFFLAAPLAGLIGAPLSGLLLQMEGVFGLHGWQWMFLIEGLPAVFLSFVTYFYLTDRPAEAEWLTAEERESLAATMREEYAGIEAEGSYSLMQALTHRRTLYLGILYIGLVSGLYGIAIWMPTILKSLGTMTVMQATLLTAVPFGVAAAGSIVWANFSDRTGERYLNLAATLLVGAGGYLLSALVASPLLAMIFLTIAAIGVYSALPIFWTLPSTFLTGVGAAGGIALVNSMGGLGGFAGPFVVGWIRDSTGQFTYALIALAGAMALSGLGAIALRRTGRGLAAQPKGRLA